MDHFTEQMKKVVAVYKAKKYASEFTMAIRQGMTQESNPNVVTFNNFDNWGLV